MKKADIEIGAMYRARVARQFVNVRVLRTSPYGGWDAVNLSTMRRIRIRSAARLRGLARACPPLPSRFVAARDPLAEQVRS